LLSLDAQVYPVIALPPVAGATQVTISVAVCETEVIVGAAGVAGTVVTVTELDAADAEDVPIAFVAVTVAVVTTPDPKPVITNGEEAPVTVCVALCTEQYADAVKDVAAGPVADAVKVTLIEPLLYALEVPTFVAVPIVGASGCKKLSCAEDLIPLFLLTAIYYSSFLLYQTIMLLSLPLQPKDLLLS